MGDKLLPPLLEGVLPAFYSDGEGIDVTIPFSMSRGVSANQVHGFAIKIKTIHSGLQLFTTQITDSSAVKNFLQSQKIIFYATSSKFYVGQFYKVQIAYINSNNVIGHYSTVGVIKCTTRPSVTVANLNPLVNNAHIYTYEGLYESEDPSERVYSYHFNLFNSKAELIAFSGELLHNSENDGDLYSSRDSYTFLQDLELNQLYYIQYGVTTINQLKIESQRYEISQQNTIDSDLVATLEACLNYDNGYVDIKLHIENPSSGSFVIVRTDQDSNYMTWKEIKRFQLNSQIGTLCLCRDFIVEQGKTYRYAIQQYNISGLHSNRLKSNAIFVDFEDAFLYDGERQLRIRYNPKVSSFKRNVQEAKVDTIGSKYPFIFRNNSVYYSEFPISGLISYWMDNENLFFNRAIDFLNCDTNLTGENISLERDFKMFVLDWLNNGKTKIFRSPTEGNFFVRLMNNTLSPVDTVNRMLHTFSCTAYEIEDYSTHKFLIEDEEVAAIPTITQWETIEFLRRDPNGILSNVAPGVILNRHPATTVKFEGMMPGEKIEIRFKGDRLSVPITIGATGFFYINTGTEIEEIKLLTASMGQMTYSYEVAQASQFDLQIANQDNFENVQDVILKDIIGRQIIGAYDILALIKGQDNLLTIFSVEAERRPVLRCERDLFMSLDDFKRTLTNDWFIFEIGFSVNGEFVVEEYYDAHNQSSATTYAPSLTINNQVFDLTETQKFNFDSTFDINSLVSGNGIVVTISYQIQEIKEG